MATLETKDTIKAKANLMLGLNAPNPTDIIHREDYETEFDYIDALYNAKQKMQTPEWRQAVKEAQEAQQEQEYKETREAQRKEWKEIRREVQLDQMEQREVDAKAADLARRDLAAGRIFASGLGTKIEEYAEILTNEAKDKKATSIQFNKFIRG